MRSHKKIGEKITFNMFVNEDSGNEVLKKSQLAGGVMAGSVATLAIIWISLQTMGYTNFIGSHKLSGSLPNDFTTKMNVMSQKAHVDSHATSAKYSSRKPIPDIDERAFNKAVSFAQTLVDRMATLESNLINAGIELAPQSPELKQYLTSLSSDEAFKKGVDAILSTKASYYLAHENCGRFISDKSYCARFISSLKVDEFSLDDTCGVTKNMLCDARSMYRSITGRCNNLYDPVLGSSMTAYNRILPAHYLDGIQEPRHIGHMKKSLPNPRAISVSLSVPNDQSDANRTLALMQWTQFITHDISQTAVRKMVSSGKPIFCCDSHGFNLSPRHVHPDCAAIQISITDPIYGKKRISCMNYVRSLPAIASNCTMGPLEQMNQVTHFLDGSTIYGSTLKRSHALRTFEKGLLKVRIVNNGEYLSNDDAEELGSQCEGPCYASGDDRVNVQPQLAVVHTIWHREHNRVAKRLAQLNPNWTDEILYQESRRIVIAEIQHITFREWLPILLGKKYSSTGVSNQSYYSHEDPSISNEAATAAFQFSNSLMQGSLKMPDETRQDNNTLQLSDYFFKPRVIESYGIFDGLLRGLATQTTQKMDTNFVSDITSNFLKTNKDFGLDAISLDIQRGRDHGLPGYNHYRKHCGISIAESFEDFLDHIPSQIVQKLKKIYSHPNDVDLLIGGMAERPEDDGLLGPTFNCIIQQQFTTIRRTDKFFYDSVDQFYPFKTDQLAELRKVTLARVFCDNGNDIQRMQPNVFMKPQCGNELSSCQDFEAIPSVDLFAWAERAKAYR